MIELEEKNRSYSSKGDKVFYLDEIYVLMEYRNYGVGQKLYEFMESFAKHNECQTITVNAVSKDYKKLLSFYIDRLNMNFHSAFLVKKI